MIRKILGVIVSYAIFAVSAVLLFKVSGRNPHAEAATDFKILTAIYGSVFASLCGWILPLMTRSPRLLLNFVLAAVMAGFAAISLCTSYGSHWTQRFAIIIFAPMSILGGICRLRFKSNKQLL